MQEKLQSFVEKAKAAVNRLPFAGMAQKVPALSKAAGYANYAACVLAVALVASVTFAACNGKKDGGSASSAKAGKSSKVKAAAGLELVAVPAAEFTPVVNMFPLASGHLPEDMPESKPQPVSVSPFLIAKTETTYEQWYEVKKWAEDEARGDKRYRFAGQGREGSGRGGKTDKVDGAAPTADKNEPVTCIAWETAVVWCNALSEKAGLEPVYYLDGAVCRDEKKLSEVKMSGDFEEQMAMLRYDGYRYYTVENEGIIFSYINGKWPTDTDGNTIGEHDEWNFNAIRKLAEENNVPLFNQLKADMTKNGFRLPTLPEWELAFRGGKPGSFDWDFTYSGSDTASEVGYYRDECGWQQNIKDFNEYLSEYGTKPVAQKKANALGIYDMSGNVSEFLNDYSFIYDSNEFNYIDGDHVYKPMQSLYLRVRRIGGSWSNDPSGRKLCDTVAREAPNKAYANVGFRVARNAH